MSEAVIITCAVTGAGDTASRSDRVPVLLGGNVRVGLEDNLYLARGRLATNGELMARAVELIGRLGRSVASPQAARQRLGLRD
jgi:uncharacterized protein (DUF849 family)